jgi:hypothetical protein
MRWERNGKVVLADVPNAGVTRTDTNARSGNPRHDVRSGKFGSTGAKPKRGAPKVANVDDLQMARMVDKVRLAARQLKGEVGVEQIERWLKGKIKNPAEVDPQGFLNFVQEQRMNDLVDAIDARLRGGGLLGKSIRVTSSRGFITGALRQLDADQVANLAHRLEALGHSPKNIDRFLGKRVAQEALDGGQEKRTQLRASMDDMEPVPEILELELNSPEATPENATVMMAEAMKMMAYAQQNQQPPVIHVQPNVTVQIPPRNRRLKRDPKTGVIDVIEEEDA